MDELINTFHIDIKMLAAQVVNFAIVVGVLYKFAYKPLLKHMDERSDIIKKGLADAKKAQEQLESAEKAREEKFIEAKKEAKEIIENAQRQAEESKQEIVGEAKKETEKVIEQAKKQIHTKKEEMVKEAKQEIGQLVIQTTEKILSKELDSETRKSITRDALQNI